MNWNNYFSHDSNARNSTNLISVRMKYGAEGYGIYFMILERLREEKNYMSIKDYNAIAFDLRVDASKVKAVVEDFGLFVFTDDGEYFYSEGFLKRMEMKDEKSKARSEAGKKGAEKRWGKKKNSDIETSLNNSKAKKENSNAIAKPQNNIASKVKLSKEKESKVAVADGGQAESFRTFEQLWLFPNLTQREILQELIDIYGDDLVNAAIKIAGSKDVLKNRAMAFIEACLQEWADNNVNTLDEARVYQKARSKKQSYAGKGTTQRKETMPEWVDQEIQETPLSPEDKAELDKRIEQLKRWRKEDE